MYMVSVETAVSRGCGFYIAEFPDMMESEAYAVHNSHLIDTIQLKKPYCGSWPETGPSFGAIMQPPQTAGVTVKWIVSFCCAFETLSEDY